MGLKSAPGFLPGGSWIRLSSETSTVPILTSLVGRQEPSLEGGVLSWVELSCMCVFVFTKSPVISDPVTLVSCQSPHSPHLCFPAHLHTWLSLSSVLLHIPAQFHTSPARLSSLPNFPAYPACLLPVCLISCLFPGFWILPAPSDLSACSACLPGFDPCLFLDFD